VQSGEVALRKEVITERKQIDVPVEREEVVIERRGVTDDATGEQIGEDEEIRVPVSEERVNVSKETVTTGEVNVSKRKTTETRHVEDDVRREELRVDRQGEGARVVDKDSESRPAGGSSRRDKADR